MFSLKRISMLLVICLLAAMLPAALAEAEYDAEPIVEDVISEPAEDGVSEADTAGADNGLWVESGAGEAFDLDVAQEGEVVPEADFGVEAPALDMGYARVAAAGAPVYFDVSTTDVIALLAVGETVLVTGADDGRVPVAFDAEGNVFEGYMNPADIVRMDGTEAASWLDIAAASGSVALYGGDLNWPLVPLGADSVVEAMDVMANGNYQDLGNDKEYTINGKTIHASQFPDTGAGHCWEWAQKVYQELWGCHFNSEFEGSAATGMNMLRKLSDDERTLTTEHLKNFVQSAQPGATIRVSSCLSTCSQWANDGLSCGHKGHSLIIVDKNSEGVFTMDSHSNSQHTRFYSWQGFCNSWKAYDHVKYIKWPNAPALPPTQYIDGIAVSGLSATYRVRATAASGAPLLSKPVEGPTLGTLSYPATFAVTNKTVDPVGDNYWLYGTTEAGVAGWVALDGCVANVNDRIEVTGVGLSQGALVVVEGGTASLTAVVEPIDATDQGVKWSSSDTGVVTVEGGKLTGVKTGTATVTVTTDSEGKTATCKVSVVKAMTEKALKRTGSNGTVKLAPGQQLRLTPKFATSKGWKVKSVKSSKTGVATVDASGVVTAKAAGKTKITVTTSNKKKATLTVQVVDTSAASGVKLNKKGTVKLKVGATLKLNATVSPATAATTLTWKSSKPAVASVDADGNVVALKKGTCTVAVKTGSGKLAKVKIKVVK